MTTPDYIYPKIRVQIEEKLFSIINFKGRKAEEVKKTLLLRAFSNKSFGQTSSIVLANIATWVLSTYISARGKGRDT